MGNAKGYILAIALPSHIHTSLYLCHEESDDFRRPGEIEGLAVDPATDDLLVLANRGARIVLGMPRGFYPGYDGEVHEVYVFEKVK